MSGTYSYASSIKSTASDELINTHLIRPLAGLFVRILFRTRVTPNQVTLAAILAGFVAAYFYLDGTHPYTLVAGLCVTLKDILDSGDGQLARAKQQYSRSGRFLDSIGDFAVNLLVFAAITTALFREDHSYLTVLAGGLAFLGMTLRVSYHVFYQTSFLHLANTYRINRVTEEVREEDLMQDQTTIRLQRCFQALYGWQDFLMKRIDAWCRPRSASDRVYDSVWFADRVGLRISGLLGLGTELFVLMLFSVAGALKLYLAFNVGVLNLLWLSSILYRRRILARRLIAGSPPARSADSP